MDDVARMEPGDRRDLFVEAAARLGNIRAGIIEKDFWVCWTLKHIFGLGPAPAQLIFKGGTSLSKVYGVIERFSEDVDLSLSREDLGFVGDRDPYQAPSNKKKQALVDAIVGRCREVIRTELFPRLHARFESILGPCDSATPWSLSPDENDPQTLRFTYPAGIAVGGDEPPNPYVRRVVLLELGRAPTIGRLSSIRCALTRRRHCRGCSGNRSARFARLVPSGRSGRRRRSCTPKRIGRPISRWEIACHATITTWPNSTSLRSASRRWPISNSWNR